MSKILYAYFNDKDLCHFFSFLRASNIPIFTSNSTALNEAHAIGTKLSTLFIPVGETRNIEISMCYYAGCFLQPGMIRIEGVPNPQELSVFNSIKKYIRQSYRLSNDKTYYIGPSIYSDWLHGEHKLPVLFEYDEFFVLERNVEAIFTSICNRGFVILANDIRLRYINDWTSKDESLVICDDVNKLSKSIIRKTIVHYDYGSVCIFVYKDPKRKQYRLVWDKRIDVVTNHKLIQLYEDIRKDYGQ